MTELVSLTPEFREHLEEKYGNERFEDPRDEERDDDGEEEIEEDS